MSSPRSTVNKEWLKIAIDYIIHKGAYTVNFIGTFITDWILQAAEAHPELHLTKLKIQNKLKKLSKELKKRLHPDKYVEEMLKKQAEEYEKLLAAERQKYRSIIATLTLVLVVALAGLIILYVEICRKDEKEFKSMIKDLVKRVIKNKFLWAVIMLAIAFFARYKVHMKKLRETR